MKRYKQLIYIAVALLAASALAYFVHYLIFQDFHHIAIYLIGDIAFLPLQVIVVAIIIERVLARHEKQKLMNKLNMVIGTFFSELGIRLIGTLSECVENGERIRPALSIDANWTAADYRRSLRLAREFDYKIAPDRVDLKALREMLSAKRDFCVSLLANPNLLENERFTGLLRAIFHLMEELAARDSLENLPPKDLEHIAGDIKRVYSQLTVEWLLYCRYLQDTYPYIFSIVARTHPLQENPSATVK